MLRRQARLGSALEHTHMGYESVHFWRAFLCVRVCECESMYVKAVEVFRTGHPWRDVHDTSRLTGNQIPATHPHPKRRSVLRFQSLV